MDEHSINTLITAYSAAPSTDLARLISVELLKGAQVERAEEYLSSIEQPLEDQHAEELVELLLQSKRPELGLRLVDKSSPLQALLSARCALAQGERESAKLDYLDVIAVHPALASDALNMEFGVSPSDVKPRLRVVEKSDVLDLTDFAESPAESIGFSAVAGLSSVKKQIERKIILPFSKPSLYQRFRKKIGGGVLLYGPPGCGKTLIARATAGEANARFINVQISDVLDMYIGESERKLQMIFEKARNKLPTVLFFDELEALAGKREYGRNSSAAQVVSQFLSELDGFEQNNQGLLVLASTNTPWAVDAAFLRPGRFDRLFFVPPPDKEARQAILELELKDKPTDNINLSGIVAKTSGFSGADLANLVDAATDEAIESSLEAGEDVPISQPHIVEALRQMRPTTTEWLTTARNYAQYANDGGRYDEVLDFLKRHAKR